MVLAELIDGIFELPGLFADIATHDPISAILILVGAIVLAASFGFFGILVLGAVVEFLTPDSVTARHP
jgi:hypothetical protein